MKGIQALFVLTFTCTLFSAFSQRSSGLIKGRIVSADGTPAASVSVELKHTKRIAVTNDNGFFVLQWLPALEDSLIVSSVQSEMYSRLIKIANSEIIDLGTITLNYNIRQLQKVEIIGRTAHTYKSDYSFLGTKTQTALLDIPQSISSITKELIHDKMEFTLNEAVTDVAGVNHYSGFEEYTIRGFRAENPSNINGLRGYNTSYVSPMLVNIERVEVIKGPVATLYGNSDPGGTINLVTKKPLEKKGIEINVGGGSWDHFRAEGDVTGPLDKSKKILYRFNAGYDQSHSFRNRLYENCYQLAPSVSFIPNDKLQVNIDLSISHNNTVLDRGQPGINNDANLQSTSIKLMASQPGDHLKQTSIATVASVSYKINKHISFNGGYLNYITQQNVGDHGVKNYVSADSVSLYYTQWSYHTMTNTLTNYFNFQFNTAKINHQLVVGYDFIGSDVKLDQWYGELPDQFGAGSGIVGGFSLRHPQYPFRPVNTYTHAEEKDDELAVEASIYHTQGIYLQEQLSLNRWKLLIGLREELYSGGDDDDSVAGLKENIFLPRIGIVYDISSNLALFGTYNKGFDPFEASSTIQIFNEPFKPVESELIEAGAKAALFGNKLFASISIYQLLLHNVAVNANNPSNPDLYVQRGEDRSRGIEVEANGNVLPNLGVNFSYAYNEAKIVKSEVQEEIGKIRENAPKHSSSSWIKYSFTKGALKGLSLAIGHSQVGNRNTLVNGLRLPGYIIFESGIQYHYKNYSLAFNVNNLSNKTYWSSAFNNINKWPGAPRNCMINIGYRF